ncbi:MAG: sulfopyruvate decarboxylase subunit alpha [Candidatus Aminicenantes bacterium]|nr:sulfopyruvate decarboxylase subunit alpha [Candidatus Aminicenantes bacterium]
MKAADFLDLLEKKGFNFFTGVPCSYFTPLCNLLAVKETTFHIPAVREDIALGLACGAYLAGKLPVVYMQNSGIGYSLEAFASLPIIYRMPVLVLTSYRGPQDQDMEEHLVMGQHTEEILQSFKIKYSIFGKPCKETAVVEKAPDIQAIRQYLLKEELPYFLLVGKGALT